MSSLYRIVYNLLQARLIYRDLALIEHVDLLFINVNAGYVKTLVSETCS